MRRLLWLSIWAYEDGEWILVTAAAGVRAARRSSVAVMEVRVHAGLGPGFELVGQVRRVPACGRLLSGVAVLPLS